MRSTLLITSLLMASLQCCGPQQSGGGTSSPVITEPTAPAEKQIVYLFFTIKKDENGAETVAHTGTQAAPGSLKEGSLPNKKEIPGNLMISFLTKDGQTISSQIIEDPLHPEMETYAEEGLERKKMQLKSAEFSVRFNQPGNISVVQVEKLTPDSKKHLLTITL